VVLTAKSAVLTMRTTDNATTAAAGAVPARLHERSADAPSFSR
jgi:hypothetical protein